MLIGLIISTYVKKYRESLMTRTPSNLTYFGSLNGITQVLRQLSLPVFQAHQLNDPFMPVRETELPFSISEFYSQTVKYICHAILARTPPRGNPSHPLQKAIIRWRMEERFNDESEIKETLQGLLPGMVEPVYNEAKSNHQAFLDYIASKRVIPFFNKYDDLTLWQLEGFAHQGVAIKFKCLENSIFEQCHAVNYIRKPASGLDPQKYVDYMVGLSPEVEIDFENVLIAQNYQQQKFKEWRLLIDSDQTDNDWLPFPKELIQGIYVGALVNQDTIVQLKTNLNKVNKKIPIYQAHCKSTEFAFEFEKVELNE